MIRLFLLILPLIFSTYVMANQCSDLFKSKEIEDLSTFKVNNKITDRDLFEIARNEIARLSQVNGRSFLENKLAEVLNSISYNKKFRNELLIEAKRRDYVKLAEKLKIEIVDDVPSMVKNNKHYFSFIYSLVVNGSLNVLTNHFLGSVGYIFDIPKIKIFDPRKVPDEVLHEIISSPTPGPKFKKYISLHLKYGIDYVWNKISSSLTVSILIYLLLTNYEMIIDPSGYLQNQLIEAIGSINYSLYVDNLEKIRGIELKISEMNPAIDSVRIKNGLALLDEYREINSKLVEGIPSYLLMRSNEQR